MRSQAELEARARVLIAESRARRLATVGTVIPTGWGSAVGQTYPDIWRHYGPGVPAGWIDICIALSEHLREAAPGAMIEDSKEKYGGLSISLTGYSDMPDDAYELSEIYENLSLHTCQDCGERGVLRTIDGWDATLCDKHSVKRDEH